MKKILLLSLCSIFSIISLFSQTVILDFESPATSTDFQYFGSTLEATLNNTIDNPDASGINTSAKVADHVKPMGSEVWAGAFAVPAVATPFDLITASEICMKVWFNQPGNVALKLEEGSNPNWITTREVTQTQTWTEICFDANEASIEDPFAPAAGGIYEGLVLFFDFGTTFTADQTYYFDDIIIKSSGNTGPHQITFNVDMNSYAGFPTTVYASGTFNEWSGDATPLDDSDGDGVWTGTATVESGAHEYKFQVDEWTDQEDFTGFSSTCTITTDDPAGPFVNRRLIASADANLSTVCFNSCFACGEAVKITLEVGSGGTMVSPEGLFIAGGGNFGNPGDNGLTDADGDGIWTGVFEKAAGFESHYTFTNGICPDWSCKEDIADQDCADPDQFNDRFMGPFTADATISTCFGLCTDDASDCAVSLSNVTFSVNMDAYPDAFTTPFLSGTVNNWAANANPLEDPDGDNIWSTTIQLAVGSYEYKFQLDEWTVQEEFADGDPCTITDPTGQFVNRHIDVMGDMEVCFGWDVCTDCDALGLFDLSVDESIFTVQPTLVQSETLLTFGERFNDDKIVKVYDALGQLINLIELNTGTQQYTLDTNNLNDGLYFINVQTDAKQQTQRIIINH